MAVLQKKRVVRVVKPVVKPVAKPSAVIVAPKTLRKGDSGTSVSLLKHKLGVMGFPVVTASLYDEATEGMVKRAQASLKLPVTGMADPVTISRINQAFQKIVDKSKKPVRVAKKPTQIAKKPVRIDKRTKKPTTLWEMWTKRR